MTDNANAALWRIVIVRLRSQHAPTIDYLERRVTAGNSKRDAIRCLKRYLARELYNDIQATVDHDPTTIRDRCLTPRGASDLAWQASRPDVRLLGIASALDRHFGHSGSGSPGTSPSRIMRRPSRCDEVPSSEGPSRSRGPRIGRSVLAGRSAAGDGCAGRCAASVTEATAFWRRVLCGHRWRGPAQIDAPTLCQG